MVTVTLFLKASVLTFFEKTFNTKGCKLKYCGFIMPDMVLECFRKIDVGS